MLSGGKTPKTQPRRPNYGGGGPPAWLVFLLGVAFVFGAYYVWTGVSDFIASGGMGVMEATEQVLVRETATAEQIEVERDLFTPRPTFTPMPECQDFAVIVPNAIVRAEPNTGSEILESLSEGTPVCVLGSDGDWYIIDLNPVTRRIETGYMFFNIIEAENPTLTPTQTFTPAPTLTPAPSQTPSLTPTPRPTQTPDPDATDTPTPTPLPTATPAFQSV